MSLPLANRTIALAEGRQLEELAQMLEREGARTIRCPMVNILDAPDPAPVVAWLRDLAAGRFDYVLLFTGEGVRRLLRFAERESMRDAVIEALRRTRTVSRGPKPVRALQEIGVAPTVIAQAPTTEGVIATLEKEALQGKTVGVQLYSEANAPLTEFLGNRGAVVHSVLPYVYAPAADADRVADLLERMAADEVDAVIFTSSPQVDRIFEVAAERGLQKTLEEGLRRTQVAAVGPVVAETLERRNARVDICPSQGFVMKNLVQHIKRAFADENRTEA